MMFTESLNAGAWESRQTMDIVFVIGRTSLEFSGNATGATALSIAAARLGPFGINGAKSRMQGRIPGPSSMHSGGANVAFCGGHVKLRGEYMDHRIYAWLMS